MVLQALGNGGAKIGVPFLDFPDLYAVYDLDPEGALACKRRLLDGAAAEGTLVFAPHFPFPALGRIQKAEKGWAWLPVGQ